MAQPPWLWGKYVNSSAAEYTHAVAYDTSGNSVIAVGVFNSAIGSYFGSDFISANGGGFVAKYDQNGNLTWAFKIGNNQDDDALDVAVDSAGYIYVTGYFENIADLKGTSGSGYIISSTGGRDIYLAKYSPAGTLVWAATGGGSGNDEGYTVCLSAGRVFIGGYYTNSATIASVLTSGASGQQNAFIAGYTQNGIPLWLAEGASDKDSHTSDLASDNTALYATGNFKGSPFNVIDSSRTVKALLNNGNSPDQDGWVASFNLTGGYRWSQVITSSKPDYSRAIAQAGNFIYITGALNANTTFPAYSGNPVSPSALGLDAFIAQLNKSNGSTNWVNAPSGNNDQEGRTIDISASGEPFVGGHFDTQMNISGGPLLSSAGGLDAFIAAFSQAGTIRWARSFGSPGSDAAYGVTCDRKSNYFYVGGDYSGSINFGSFTLPSGGSSNIFVNKLGCVPLASNTISAAQTICSGDVPATLSGSLPSGGSLPYTYVWEQSPNSITWSAAGGTNNLQNYSPPALLSSTYFRRVVVSGAGCTDTLRSTNILVSVDQKPSTALAGTDQAVCSNNSAFNGNTPSTGTGTWTLLSGSGTITSPNSPVSTVTGMSLGQNRFIWTITNGVCPASRDTVMIQVDQFPTTSNAGADQTICSTSATLAGNTPLIGSGMWSLITGSGTINSVTSPNSAVTGLGYGNNVFVWTISNGSCPPSRDTVTIRADQVPSLSNAGPDQTICSSSSVFAANTPSVGTGTWSLVSGSGTITSSNSPVSAVTSLSVGQNIFVWTISNGSCPPSRDTVTINVDAVPTTANAGADQVICSSSGNFQGNVPLTGTGTWTLLSGTGSITSANSATSSVTGMTPGNNFFIWTIANGSCPPSRDTVMIHVDAMPTASNAGPNQQICANASVFSANTPATGTGAWSLVSGSGIIANINLPGSSVTGLSIGQNVFVWTISNGSCPPSRDTVVILVDALPTVANAGANQFICSSTGSFSGNTPSIGTGTWSLVSGTGIITFANSPTSSVSGLSIGQNVFVWTISNGSCPPSRDTVVINVDAMPTVSNAGSDKTICSSADTLSGNIPVIGTGSWTLLSGSGTIGSSTSAKTAVTGLAVGANRFIWTISNGSCPPSRDTVTMNVDAMPTAANAGSDRGLCASSDTLYGNIPTTGSGTWTQISGSGFISNPSAAKTAVSGLSTGINTFVWTITNGTCPSSKDTVSITVYPLPSVSNAGSDQVICASQSNLAGNIPSVGTGQWSLAAGTGTVTNPASAVSGVTGLSVGINKFVWSISNGNCPVSRDTVTITVDPMPSISNAGADQAICMGPNALLSANTPLTGTGLWSLVSGSGTINSPTSPLTAVTGLSIGDNRFVWTITSGSCPPSRDTVLIHVDEMPTAADAGPDQVVYNTRCTLAANVPLTGTGTWSSNSGQVVFGDIHDPGTTATGLQPGPNVLRWTISNGVCPDSYDEVIITLKELEIPNGFSPNGDGVNDDFRITGLDEFSDVKLYVFNRWGNEVYHSTNYKNDWNGKNLSGQDLTDDTYYFILRVSETMLFKSYVIMKRR